MFWLDSKGDPQNSYHNLQFVRFQFLIVFEFFVMLKLFSRLFIAINIKDPFPMTSRYSIKKKKMNQSYLTNATSKALENIEHFDLQRVIVEPIY